MLKLVSDEVVKPLHTVQFTAQMQGLNTMMNNSNIEHQEILDKVAELSRNLGRGFYVASESSHRQYNSDGTLFELNEGQVE